MKGRSPLQIGKRSFRAGKDIKKKIEIEAMRLCIKRAQLERQYL